MSEGATSNNMPKNSPKLGKGYSKSKKIQNKKEHVYRRNDLLFEQGLSLPSRECDYNDPMTITNKYIDKEKKEGKKISTTQDLRLLVKLHRQCRRPRRHGQ